MLNIGETVQYLDSLKNISLISVNKKNVVCTYSGKREKPQHGFLKKIMEKTQTTCTVMGTPQGVYIVFDR